MTPSRWMIDPVLQRPLRMRESLRTTPEAHPLTDIIPSLLTPVTAPARKSHFQRNFISYLKALHILTDRYHNTSGFVAQRHRFFDHDVAIAVVPVVVEI